MCACARVRVCACARVRVCANDIVAGRVRAQLFQPAQFLSKCAHCLCLLVGGLPDSSLCV